MAQRMYGDLSAPNARKSQGMAEFDWNHLRSFLAIARCGRLTTAATRLCSDHTTLSRRITRLEECLDARLFDRSPEGYALTEQGHLLLTIAEDVERLTEAASERIGGTNGKISGVLRIGCPDGFGSCFLADRIHKLSDMHSRLSVQMVTGPGIYSLSKREADIVITVSPPNEGRLVKSKLTDYTLGLYATDAYLSQSPAIKSKEDLKHHRFVGYISEMLNFSELDYADQIVPGLATPLASSSILTQLRATVGGAGICVLPSFIARHEPMLVSVLPEMSLTRAFWLVVHEDLRDSAKVRAGINFIRGEIEAVRDLFSPATFDKSMKLNGHASVALGHAV